MNTIKSVLCFALVLTLAASCNKATYRKTPGGMPYQLFRSKDTMAVKGGNTIKVSFTQKINDSVVFTNEGKPPFYIAVDPTPHPYDLSEVWTKLHKGDSVITTQMMDSFIKRNPMNINPRFKKGDRIFNYVKVLDVFTTGEKAAQDEVAERKKWQEGESNALAQYLKDKNIPVQKTASGAFVEIIRPGEGNPVDSGKFVSVMYTGRVINGPTFDSNTDTTFHHLEPYSFVSGTAQNVVGFDEAVKMMSKGEKIRVYIPSSLGYGPSPNSPKIKPYDNLVFEIELVGVSDKAPTSKEELEQMQQGVNNNPQKVEPSQRNK